MVEGAKVFIRELEDSKLIKELIYYRDRVKSNKEIMDLLSIIHKEEDDNMLIYSLRDKKVVYSSSSCKLLIPIINEMNITKNRNNKRNKKYR